MSFMTRLERSCIATAAGARKLGRIVIALELLLASLNSAPAK